MSNPLEKLDVALYLNKINHSNNISLTEHGLYELQKDHVMNIPFENLDIQNGVPILLDARYFVDKILHRNRGGFCYELNGLFHELLNTLGFNVSMISGRVFGKSQIYGDEYDHMSLLVDVDGEEFISDVGFGEFSMRPLKIIENQEQEDERGLFKIDRYDEKYLRVLKKENDNWEPQYLFTKDKCKLEDFRGMFNYHLTNPNSHFTHKKLITKATENGRITISGDHLLIKENGVESKTLIKDTDHFDATYKQYFL